jgi:hypothetical protein
MSELAVKKALNYINTILASLSKKNSKNTIQTGSSEGSEGVGAAISRLKESHKNEMKEYKQMIEELRGQAERRYQGAKENRDREKGEFLIIINSI